MYILYIYIYIPLKSYSIPQARPDLDAFPGAVSWLVYPWEARFATWHRDGGIPPFEETRHWMNLDDIGWTFQVFDGLYLSIPFIFFRNYSLQKQLEKVRLALFLW